MQKINVEIFAAYKFSKIFYVTFFLTFTPTFKTTVMKKNYDIPCHVCKCLFYSCAGTRRYTKWCRRI